MLFSLSKFSILILINFAILIGTYIVFQLILYIFNFLEKFKKNYINKSKNVIIGIIISSIITFSIIYSYYQSNQQYLIFMYISILLVIGIFYKSSLLIYILNITLFSTCIFCIVNNVNFVNFIYLLILSVITLGFIFIIKVFKINKHYINFIFIFLLCCLSIVLYYLIFKNKTEYIVIENCFILLLFIIFYLTNIIINKNIKEIQWLTENQIYIKNKFYNYPIAKKIIKNKTYNHKGILIIFYFTNLYNLPIKLGNYIANNFHKYILNNIKNNLKKFDPIFFITPKNEYACFITLDDETNLDLKQIYSGNTLKTRNQNDPLKKYEKTLKKIPTKIIYDNNIVELTLKTSGSIYGVHNYDLNQLLKYCEINHDGNILYIYNPNINNINHNQYTSKLDIYKYFNYDDIYIDLTKKISINNKNVILPNINCINHLLFDMNDIKFYIQTNNIYDIALRWIAMITLKKYNKLNSNNSIVIDYPINYILSNEFDINIFLKKILILNIDIKNIILVLDLKYFNLMNYNINNLILLKEKNIKIWFNNFDIEHIDLLNLFTPNYITYNKDFVKDKNHYNSLLKLISKYNLNVI